MDQLRTFIGNLWALPHAPTVLGLAALALVAAFGSWVTRSILLRVVRRIVEASPARWDDAFAARGVLRRLAHVVPALIVLAGITSIPDIPDRLDAIIGNAARAYIVLTIALSLSNLFSALGDVYAMDPERARNRPIKGYLQVAKLVVFLFAAVLGIAALIDRSPLLLLSGVGAMTAVVLLVFKDTILSLVASIQLSYNDMLRVGDWIEMPSMGADGDVVDIALNTVKVQNFDKTIVTIPTYRLIEDSFTNWRGMEDSGGRRIKRAIPIDQSTVRFLDQDMQARLSRFALLSDHFKRKREELAEWNQALGEPGKDPVNRRRLTNLGCFRAYAVAFLRAHPRIDADKSLMVRQLEPTPAGLPLELYCFTNTTRWVDYEGIQSDIFDHLLAILPEFGLAVFQQPAGTDIARLAAAPVAADA